MPTIDREHIRENFRMAVEFIGKSWLEESYGEEFENPERDHKHGRSPHPLVVGFKRGRIELFDDKIDAPELFSEKHYSPSTHRIAVLGEHLRHLSDSTIVDREGELLSTDITDHLRHRLQNPDEWREVFVEMEAAALYSREGFEVHFIEEGKNKAADLLIFGNPSIHIECKRCNPVSKLDKKHGGLHEAIRKSILSHFDREAILIVDIEKSPTGEEAHNISKYLPNNSEDGEFHQIDLPFGQLFVIPFNNPGRPKPVSKHPPSAADTPYEFFDNHVAGTVEEYLDTSFNLDDFRSKHLECKQNNDDDHLYLTNPRFIGFLHDADNNRVKQILRQFSKASGKFPDESANVLHLKIPFLNDLTQEEFEDLSSGIGGKLNLSNTISGVELYWDEIVIHSEKSQTYGIIVSNIENHSPTVPLPEWFHLPGPNVDKLPSKLDFADG